MQDLSGKTLKVESVAIADFNEPWTEPGFNEPNIGIGEGKYPWTLLEAQATLDAPVLAASGQKLATGDKLVIRYYPEAKPKMFGVYDWRVENPVRNPTSEYVPPYIGVTLEPGPRAAVLFSEEEKKAIADTIEEFLQRNGSSGEDFIARYVGN